MSNFYQMGKGTVENFYKNLTYLIRQKEMGLGHVADEAEVSYTNLRRMMREQNPVVPKDFMDKIAKVLGVSVSALQKPKITVKGNPKELTIRAGEFLKLWRGRARWSRKYVSEQVGLTTYQIYMIEEGLNFDNIQRLARFVAPTDLAFEAIMQHVRNPFLFPIEAVKEKVKTRTTRAYESATV